MKQTLSFLTVLALFLVGCIATSSEPEIVATRIVQAPSEAPPTSAPDPLPASFDAALGADLYSTSCAPCHGETGLGDGETASAFTCDMPAFAQADAESALNDWYEITANGNGNTDATCLMPPWSGRLNGTEIWHVVAYAQSLRYDTSLAEQGTALLDAATTANTDYINDTAWQTSVTDADILAALADNSLEGFNFSTVLSAEEQNAALVSIRLAAFDDSNDNPETAQTQPESSATEDTAREQAQPAPVATEDAETPPETEGTSSDASDTADDASSDFDDPILLPEVLTEDGFTIRGAVENGTEGGTVPSDLVVTLRVVALDENEQPDEILRLETTINDDNSFQFDGVPRPDRAIASVETNYQDVRQFAPQIIPSLIQEDSTDITLTLYETTTNLDDIAFEFLYIESLIDAVSQEEASLTYQSFEVVNTSDRIYVGEEDVTVRLPYPLDITNVDATARADTEPRFEVSEPDTEVRYFAAPPVYPGFLDRFVLSYNIRYPGDMTVTQTFPYSVQEMSVFISQTRGLALDSDDFSPADSGTLNGITYLGFSLDTAPLAASDTLIYRVYDGENAVANEPSSSEQNATDSEDSSFLENNTTLILGIGILLIIAGGMFMVYDIQRQRLQVVQNAPSVIRTALPRNQEATLKAITELDDAFENGEIDDATYNKERQALKDHLRQFL